MTSIRAITIRQPFGWAIAEGHKDVENRDWRPPERLKWLAIHAGKKPRTQHSVNPDRASLSAIAQSSAAISFELGLDVPNLEDLIFGSIIAIARLKGTHRHGDDDFQSPWRTHARFGWILDGVARLEEPFPCSGKQGLWYVPDAALPACRVAAYKILRGVNRSGRSAGDLAISDT